MIVTVLNPACGQVAHQPAGIGEADRTPGEHAIAAHVVNVEVNHVAGDAAGAELLGQVAHDGVGVVAPATLVVAQRPARR